MLLAQLKNQGHVTTSEANLHVIADGMRIDPIKIGPVRLAFALPAGCADICLKSRTFIPAHALAQSTDTRSLGVCVSRLQIDGETIGLDDASLDNEGWSKLEMYADMGDQRWTLGGTRLPTKTRLVVIDLAGDGYYWRERKGDVVAVYEGHALAT
jgi:hypothetical protein